MTSTVNSMDIASTPKPIWEPGQDRIERANLNRFMRFVRERTGNEDIRRYSPLYDFSIRKPERFWQLVWEFCGIRANGDFEPALVDGDKMPGAVWFPNVRLNFAQNLLRYKDDRTAIEFRNERGQSRQITYSELHCEVARAAQALRNAGVGVGDRVAGLLPNIPEAIVAMLATASLGAIWSSCSPDFGIESLVDRFGQIEPKVLFCVDGYTYAGKAFACLEKANGVVASVPSIEAVIVIPYAGDPALSEYSGKLRSWPDFVGTGNPNLEFELLPFDHPVYILYSSGTTGAPKCIVHGAGGTLIQHLKELVLHTDLKREDRFFFHTTCAWMMWNWLASSLAVGATVVLYDGSPSWPKDDVLWDLADEIGITVFGTSARWLASIEKAGLRPGVTHKLVSLRTILSTGSPLAPESYDYVYGQIKANILLASISGGTDIISCFALGNPLMPVYRGELQCRGLGMKVEILDHAGEPVSEIGGELACTAPFPSMPVGFWDDPDGARYHEAYFSRFPSAWCHGDQAILTKRDGVVILGRSDSTLNPGGVRIGSAEVYRQLTGIEEILESIVIGQQWMNDERIVLFVRLREGCSLDDALRERIKLQIRNSTTPRHVPAKIIQVADIPRTHSGKPSEIAVLDAIHGQPVRNRQALANPRSLDDYAIIPELQD
ncbi:acetoacetate--CoA ligase [Dokdonella sp.]|uniref:acetoacetate--CoA ligase n=1 Tax=Dokdonella sp. TaxID=2291710 RepID=UPI003C4D6A78